MRDLKSLGHYDRVGSSPILGTKKSSSSVGRMLVLGTSGRRSKSCLLYYLAISSIGKDARFSFLKEQFDSAIGY